MRSWKFWEGSAADDNQADADAAQRHSLPGRTAPVGEPIPQPVDTPAPNLTHEQAQLRLATLTRRREGILFDLDQAELATMPENPWRERIALYGETIKVVQSDIAALDREPRVSRPALLPTPIQIETVAPDDPAVVAFTVGAVVFRYESEIDWAERGTTIARGELICMQGDPAQLIPADMPVEYREELVSHLDNSLFIFATDLRHLADEGKPFPDATLSDLAKPCPLCGHWQSWGGFCAVCAERANRRRALEAEFMRISAEQAAEEEERSKWVERLPIARRRLADVDAEIAALARFAPR